MQEVRRRSRIDDDQPREWAPHSMHHGGLATYFAIFQKMSALRSQPFYECSHPR